MASGFAELTHQAHALVAAGDLAGARELLGPPLREADPSPGNASPELAEAAGLQARVLVSLGDPHSARGWAAFAYSATTRLYGAADQRTIATAAALAAVLHRVGSHARAARLYRDVIIELTATDGPESLRVLAAHADLATVEYAQGECTLARNRLEDAWELHREVYGDGHVAGIRMLARLGAMQRDCGLFTSAHEHLALARELCREHLSADHPLAAQVGALARAAADPDHVCADATPDSADLARGTAGLAQGTASPAHGAADPAQAAADLAAAPTARTELSPGFPAAPTGESGPGSGPPPGYPAGLEHPATPPRYGHPAGPSSEPEHPPDADLPPLDELPPHRYPAARRAATSRGFPSATPAPQVPPPRLPPAPPVDPPPRWAAPPGPDPGRSARPPVPPPRTSHQLDGTDDDPDPEHDRWPPEMARRQPDGGIDATEAGSAGSGWSRAAEAPPPGAYADGLDAADGVRRVRNLPERRSSRLPVRIHRPPPTVGRLPMIIVAGLVVVVLAGTAAVMVGFGLTGGDGSDPDPTGSPAGTPTSAPPSTPAPAAPGTPPGAVTLSDNRTSVSLAWAYPPGAEGLVVVAGGRTGQELRPFEELPGGSTGYVVYGLDSQTNYCFAISVVYSATVVGRAEPVCTDRAGASPAG